MRQTGLLLLFAGLMAVHALLHAASLWVIQRRHWLPAYCLVQGALVFAIGYLTQSGVLILGLNMALVGETVGMVWPDR